MPKRFRYERPRPWISIAAEYLGAVLISAAAVYLSVLIRPFVPGGQYSLSIIAVLLSANLGGSGPGLISALIGTVAGPLLIVDPDHPAILDGATAIRTSGFFAVCAVGIYLTARKREAITALKRTVTTRDLIGKVTNDCVWDWDLRTNLVRWNEVAESLFGIPRNPSGNDVRSWTDGIHPNDTERVIAGVHRVIQSGGDGWTDHYRFRRRDGTYADVLDRGYVIRDNKGQPVEMVGSMLDLSERMSSQQKLVENEERLRTAIEAGRTGVWDWDIVTSEVSWSERTFEIHGLKPKDFDGTMEAYRALVHPDDATLVSDALAEAIKNRKPYDVEFRIVRPSGETRWVQTKARVIYDSDGRALRIVGATVDITDSKIDQMQKEYLVALGETLSTSFDAADLIARLSQGAVPSMGDWCIVNVYDEPRDAQVSAGAHISRTKSDLIRKAMDAVPFDPRGDSAAARVIRTGKSEIVTDLARESEERPEAKDALAFWARLGTTSYICSPLRSPSGIIGAITLGISESARRFNDGDLRFLDDVARRAGVAVENALLHRQTLFEIEERRNKENQLRLVTDSMPALVSYIDADHIYRFANAAYEQWFGLQRDEVIGKHIRDVIGDDAYNASLALFDRAFSGELVRFERRIHLPLRGEAWLDATYTPHIDNGVVRGVFVTAHDVTVSRKSEQRIRRQAELLDSAHDAIIVRDLNGIVTFWNRGAEEVYGWSAEQALGRVSHELLGTEFSTDLAEINQSLKVSGKWDGELTHRTRSGERIVVGSRWLMTSEPSGESAVLEINRDVSDRKRYERHLLQQAEELSRSNQELEQFAYVASHDLQEPLRKISNYTELLANRARGKLDSDLERYLDNIISSAQRMQQLIHDLLAFSRVNKSDASRAPVNLGRVLSLVLSDLETRIAEKNASVVVDPELPDVVASATEIRQVLQNLIGNGLKFNTNERPEVRVSARREGDVWEVKIADNGIGIEPAYHDKIFKVFHRLHTREKFPGTGIGLAICKKIVERHGGRIWVESAPGRGTAFYFTLPAAATSEAVLTGPASDHPAN